MGGVDYRTVVGGCVGKFGVVRAVGDARGDDEFARLDVVMCIVSLATHADIPSVVGLKTGDFLDSCFVVNEWEDVPFLGIGDEVFMHHFAWDG